MATTTQSRNPMRTGESKSKPTGNDKKTPRRSVLAQKFSTLPPITKTTAPRTANGEEVKVGGHAVTLYNDDYFALIREKFSIPANIAESSDVFDWKHMEASLGKGGDPMCFILNRRYIIKELGSDHPTLLSITREYVEHVCGDSFLARFALHFKRNSDQKNYVLMNSWLPGSEQELKDKKNYPEDGFEEIYDLKGCADDKMMSAQGKTLEQVHKRFHNCKMHCCKASEERRMYKAAKIKARTNHFFLHFDERKRIMAKIQSDAQFLRMKGLMDYSLIVGIKKCAVQVFEDKYLPRGGFSVGDRYGSEQMQPYYAVHTTEKEGKQVLAYYIGVIDFLQFWTCAKKVAHHIKCCDVKPLATVVPFEYGIRFDDYFSQKFVLSSDPTPAWLQSGRKLRGLGRNGAGSNGVGGVDGNGGGGGGGGGGKSGSSGGKTMASAIPKHVETMPTPVHESTVKQIVTGAAMVMVGAGVAAVEMGGLGAPKEDEATREWWCGGGGGGGGGGGR